MTGEWRLAYLAVSALLGEPDCETLLAVDAASPGIPPDSLRGLRSSSREARARAIARVVSDVVLALDAARLA